MKRSFSAGVWAVGVPIALLSMAAAGTRIPGRTLRAAEPMPPVGAYEGVSTSGNVQEALDDAVARAVRAMPSPGMAVHYRVAEITGQGGGSSGNTLRVVIHLTGDVGKSIARTR